MTLVYDVTLILLCVTFLALGLGNKHTRPIRSRRVLRPHPTGELRRSAPRPGIPGSRR